jgi:carbamate kinase
MRILVALGGNALLPRDEPATAPNQRRNVERAASALAELALEHEVIVTHGNDPEVGHMLELALRNRLPERDVVSVLTQVVVDGHDSAAEPDGSAPPTVEPNAIAEIRSLRVLVDSGALVICAGGGGIPVALNGDGTLHGVEAAVDEDLTAALLARRLDADALLLLTDVDAVYRDWGGPTERPIAGANPAELRGMHFSSSSMGAKVEAACRFAATTGRRAAIGALTDAVRVAQGGAGTQVVAPVAEPAIAAARRRPRR